VLTTDWGFTDVDSYVGGGSAVNEAVINTWFNQLAANPSAIADDTVLLYYSGHGNYDDMPPDECGTLHLPDSDDFTEYELQQDLAELPATTTKIVILDSCHSGGLAAVTQVPNTYFLSAVDFNETAKVCESSLCPTGFGGSVFTSWFTDAFQLAPRGKTTLADAAGNQDGITTLQEAFSWTDKQILAEDASDPTLQMTPVMAVGPAQPGPEENFSNAAIKNMAAAMAVYADSFDKLGIRDSAGVKIRKDPALLDACYNDLPVDSASGISEWIAANTARPGRKANPDSKYVDSLMAARPKDGNYTVQPRMECSTTLLDQDDLGPDDSPDGTQITFDGTVAFIGSDGGFYGIVGDDGKEYDPVNLPSEFAHDGQRVQVLAEIWNDGFNIHPWGSQVEILDPQQGPPAVPTAPTNLTASVAAQSVDLTWTDNSNNETGFRIAVSLDGGATWNNFGTVGANVTSFNATGLQPGTRYLFKVRAANGDVYSDYTNTVDVTTLLEPPAAPTNLTASVATRSVNLTWTDNSNNETGFRIAISLDGGATWSNVGTVGANVTSFNVTALQPGTRYLFKVRAANGDVYSDYTNTVDVTTLAKPPAAPTNLTASVAAQSVDLSWTDNSNNETGFRIAISLDGGATWSNVGTVGANVTSFNVTGLKPGTRYLFKVRAANGTLYSDYSNTVDVQTKK
jgi:hypothetical protein